MVIGKCSLVCSNACLDVLSKNYAWTCVVCLWTRKDSRLKQRLISQTHHFDNNSHQDIFLVVLALKSVVVQKEKLVALKQNDHVYLSMMMSSKTKNARMNRMPVFAVLFQGVPNSSHFFSGWGYRMYAVSNSSSFPSCSSLILRALFMSSMMIYTRKVGKRLTDYPSWHWFPIDDHQSETENDVLTQLVLYCVDAFYEWTFRTVKDSEYSECVLLWTDGCTAL